MLVVWVCFWTGGDKACSGMGEVQVTMHPITMDRIARLKTKIDISMLLKVGQ